MTDVVQIEFSKKEAELNIWLDEVFAGKMMTAKMLFLWDCPEFCALAW